MRLLFAHLLVFGLSATGDPFRKSLRPEFEHGQANEHQGRYFGVVFY